MILNPGKTEFSPEEHAELRREIQRIQAQDGLAGAEISRQADIPGPTLSQYLSDTYPSEKGRNTTAAKLWKWIESRRAAAELRRQLPVAPAFMPLHTSRQIMMIMSYAREVGRMALVTGSPGVSKTASAKQFAADNPRTWYAAMDPSTRGVNTMLVELLGAMGESDPRGTPQAMASKVKRVAREAKGLIIIDEAQHLSEQAIEALRAINDAVRVGIVMLGNESAWSRVGTTGTKPAFAQVSSRFAQRRWILTPDPRDSAALAQAWADVNREEITRVEVEYCQDIAGKPGGLRNIEMTMEGALLAAHGRDEPLTVQHLKQAFAQLSGLDRAA